MWPINALSVDYKMLLPLCLLALSVIVADGNENCIPKAKIGSVIDPILRKRKGLHVTLSPDDLVGLVTLQHGKH